MQKTLQFKLKMETLFLLLIILQLTQITFLLRLVLHQLPICNQFVFLQKN